MANLHYVVGDATVPQYKPAIVCHICNNIGAWGAGFVLALSRKCKIPENKYREWAKGRESFVPEFKLGKIQICSFDHPDIVVANMIAQEGIGYSNGLPPIRYDALEECLTTVYTYAAAVEDKVTVHMPRIGCGLAGGDWPSVEAIIKDTMTVDTYVYDLR